MMAALRLANRGLGGGVTMVNASPDFVERVRHHQLGAGTAPPRRSITRMLRGTGVRFVAGRVTRLDLDRRVARLVGGGELGFDRRRLRARQRRRRRRGAGRARARVGDWRRSGRTAAARAAGARRARGRGRRRRADRDRDRGRARRAGRARDAGGVAAASAASCRRRGSGICVRALARLGVRIVDAQRPRGPRRRGRARRAASCACDACVWAGGFRAAPLAREAGLEVSAEGRIIVDAQLRSVSHPDGLRRRRRGRGTLRRRRRRSAPAASTPCRWARTPPRTWRARWPVRSSVRSASAQIPLCLSLGRRDGLLQLVRPDGQPGGIITGRPAAWIKERILRFTVWALRLRAALRVLVLATAEAPAAAGTAGQAARGLTRSERHDRSRGAPAHAVRHRLSHAGRSRRRPRTSCRRRFSRRATPTRRHRVAARVALDGGDAAVPRPPEERARAARGVRRSVAA